jgi:hypothetical protein
MANSNCDIGEHGGAIKLLLEWAEIAGALGLMIFVIIFSLQL